MNRNIIKEILYIIIAILLSVIAVKFIIWLLPVILVLIIGFYIYYSIKKNKMENEIKNTKKEKNIKEIFDYKEK